MTRDDLLKQLHAIGDRANAAALLDEFPMQPEFTWAEKKAEADAYAAMADHVAELERLFASADADWLEAFFGADNDRRAWLRKLPGHLRDAAILIREGKTAGRQPLVFVQRIADWCVDTFEALTGKLPEHRTDPPLVRLFLAACEFASVHRYDDSDKDGVVDFRPLRNALEARTALTEPAH